MSAPTLPFEAITICGCGHPAISHHGMDGRLRGDAGCMGGPSMIRDDWCHCPKTCGDVMKGHAS